MCVKNSHYDNKNYAIKYINQYFRLNCSADMQAIRLFPNVKEIQESFGTFNIVTEHIMTMDPNITLDNPNINVYVIGDGVSPRTAATFNFLSKWKTFSIDPLMRTEKDWSSVNNLTVLKGTGEECIEAIVEQKDYIFLVFPHSHIPELNSIYKHFKNQKVWIINLPCCKPNQGNGLPIKKFIGIVDTNINSPKNIFNIYNNYLEM